MIKIYCMKNIYETKRRKNKARVSEPTHAIKHSVGSSSQFNEAANENKVTQKREK